MSFQDPTRDERAALLAYATAKLDTADLTDNPDTALAEAAFAIVAALDLAEGRQA